MGDRIDVLEKSINDLMEISEAENPDKAKK